MSKTITTPVQKIEIELKDWITGEEGEQIEAPMTDIQFKISAQNQSADLNIGEAMKKSVKTAVNIIVVKVDKQPDDVWNKIRKLPNADYKFILAAVDEIATGKDFTKPVSTQKDGTV